MLCTSMQLQKATVSQRLSFPLDINRLCIWPSSHHDCWIHLTLAFSSLFEPHKLPWLLANILKIAWHPHDKWPGLLLPP